MLWHARSSFNGHQFSVSKNRFGETPHSNGGYNSCACFHLLDLGANCLTHVRPRRISANGPGLVLLATFVDRAERIFAGHAGGSTHASIVLAAI